jgi:hypothetical protein
MKLPVFMAPPKPLPPLETLCQVLSYCPETGALTWRVDRPNQVAAGMPAGTPNGDGYIQIQLGPHHLRAHRIAWALHHGADPGQLQVDHINRNRSDNRAANLRLVDAKGNRANSSQPRLTPPPPLKRPVQVLYPDGRGALICDSVETAARVLRRDARRLTKPLATGRPLAWPVPGRPGLYTSSGIRVRYMQGL